MTEHGEEDAERPLDPATERLRRRMVRLLSISVATMLLGVMAVLAAIVYKLNQETGLPAGDPIPIALPAESVILGLALDGDMALLWLREGSGKDRESLLRIDLGDGRVVSRHPLGGGGSSGAPAEPAPMLDLYRSQ